MGELALNPRRSQLRVAYVWRDEVMADLVALRRQRITLGTRGGATFTTPDLGLPDRFRIFRHTRRGYRLSVGGRMAGRMSLGGQETDVADFVRRGGGDPARRAPDGFRAAGVSPGDWGVIHLDGRGEHTLFFQYVKPDPPLPRPTWRDTELLLPAVSFAVVLHAVLVIVAIQLRPLHHTMGFPGKRELMTGYLVSRPKPMPIAPEPAQGEKDAVEVQQPAATIGKEGRAGGKGEKPRARAPDPDRGEADELPASVQVGLLSARARYEMRKVRERGGFDEKLGRALQRIQGPLSAGSLGGHGTGTGMGFGPGLNGTGTSTRGGAGTGGGGRNLGDVQRHGPIDTGGTRAARGSPGGRGVAEVAVKVDAGEPTGELGGLTADEILKVVRSRKNAIENCYNRELQRQKGLGGKVVLTWRINLAGAVEGARVRSTTLRNGRVEDCMVRQIQSLRFPQPRGGQVANVRQFPFLLGLR